MRTNVGQRLLTDKEPRRYRIAHACWRTDVDLVPGERGRGGAGGSTGSGSAPGGRRVLGARGGVGGTRVRRRGGRGLARPRGGRAGGDTAWRVVGAGGKRSMVAEGVGGGKYGQRPPATLACYTYWSGVPLAHGE